jgi:hypothetical protein
MPTFDLGTGITNTTALIVLLMDNEPNTRFSSTNYCRKSS